MLSDVRENLLARGRPHPGIITWIRVGLVCLWVGCNGINWEVRGRNFFTTVVRFQAETSEADQTTA